MRATAALLLALASCAANSQRGTAENRAEAPAPAPPPIDHPDVRSYLETVEAQFRAPGAVTARLGETARLGNVSVRPLRVVEDSRCPQDATCVWAGRLRLAAAISGVRGEAELVLREPYALPGGGTLTLLAAAPARWRNAPQAIERGPASRFAFRRD